LKLRHWKVDPLTLLQVKKDNRKRKAADAEICTEVVLEIESAQNASGNTDKNQRTEGHPPNCAGVLAMEAPDERNQCPATRREEDNDEEKAHTRRAA